jgi:hypothetical protein
MFIIRFIKRLNFRRKIKKDQTSNVVTSMAKAKELYKRLAIEAHPDRNPQNREVAEELMSRISANRYNYAILILLEKEVIEKLK